MSETIRKNGLVVLRGSEPLKMKTDTFEPNKEYRSIEVGVGGDKEILVYGVVFSGERFTKLFKYIK
tara:strand:+ start:2243 stop:2440 length:198 start_codon:yes stop_codon:yes gene_type:complete